MYLTKFSKKEASLVKEYYDFGEVTTIFFLNKLKRVDDSLVFNKTIMYSFIILTLIMIISILIYLPANFEIKNEKKSFFFFKTTHVYTYSFTDLPLVFFVR